MGGSSGARPGTLQRQQGRWAVFGVVGVVVVIMLIASAFQGRHNSPAAPGLYPAGAGGGPNVMGASTAGTSHRAHGRSATRPACRRGNPLANVYHPYRLKVRRRCLTVTGTVAYVSRENDGDLHVDLSLPKNEAWLLNRANAAYEYNQLVTEIVPADQPGCTVGEPPRSPHGSYNFGTCTDADIAAPPLGAVIRVTGPYVLDANHGWMEIHPVWRIVILSKPPTASPRLPPIHPGNRSMVLGQRRTCE